MGDFACDLQSKHAHLSSCTDKHRLVFTHTEAGRHWLVCATHVQHVHPQVRLQIQRQTQVWAWRRARSRWWYWGGLRGSLYKYTNLYSNTPGCQIPSCGWRERSECETTKNVNKTKNTDKVNLNCGIPCCFQNSGDKYSLSHSHTVARWGNDYSSFQLRH